MMIRAKITGTGSYFPPRQVSNHDLSKMVDTSDEWIFTRTGIRTRHLIDHEGAQSTADLAEQAANKALLASNSDPIELDMIIVCTLTPDYRCPSAAVILQNRLGAKNASAFDLGAACAGSLYGLTIANQFIKSGANKKILVVGAETLSNLTNWKDRNTCVLFGDGAGAVVVEPSHTQTGFETLDIYADGSHWNTIYAPDGGSRSPNTKETIGTYSDRLVMNGRETFKYAVRALVDAAKTSLEKCGLSSQDVKHVVAHQANMRIIEQVANRLEVPLDRFVLNIERYGNTSSASLLTTFDEGARDGRYRSGDPILMLAIGAGFAWASGLYRT